MLERKLFGKIGAIPETVCDRGEKTPDRLGRENLPPSPFGLWRDKPGDGAFALGLCCRRRYSPLIPVDKPQIEAEAHGGSPRKASDLKST